MTTRLLTLRDVTHMTALSRSAVYALMAESRFPQPIRIGARAAEDDSAVPANGSMRTRPCRGASEHPWSEPTHGPFGNMSVPSTLGFTSPAGPGRGGSRPRTLTGALMADRRTGQIHLRVSPTEAAAWRAKAEAAGVPLSDLRDRTRQVARIVGEEADDAR